MAREAVAFHVAGYFVAQRHLVPEWRPDRLCIGAEMPEANEPGAPPACGWDFAHELDPNAHDIEIVASAIYAGTTAQLWRVRAVDLCTAARFEWADELLMTRCPLDDARAQLRARLLARAARLVREQWAAIEALAQALCEQGELSCDQAECILEDACTARATTTTADERYDEFSQSSSSPSPDGDSPGFVH